MFIRSEVVEKLREHYESNSSQYNIENLEKASDKNLIFSYIQTGLFRKNHPNSDFRDLIELV